VDRTYSPPPFLFATRLSGLFGQEGTFFTPGALSGLISRKGADMLTKSFFLIVIVGLLILTTGCGQQKLALTAADKGSQVEVTVGQQILITLDGNPSTGYSWEVKDLDTSLLEQVGEAEFESSAPSLLGSGGTLTLTFKALQTGTTMLTLVYHRPWETEVAPLDTFSVTVVIQ
jgi:inhibitor of cysteine peptidase